MTTTMPRTTTRPPRRKRAAIYCRLSENADGTHDGTARQLVDLRDYCAAHGLTIVGEYLDDDRSASRFARKGRDGFDGMMSDVAAGAIDAIVCADVSRYSRIPRLVEDLLDAHDAARGVELHGLDLDGKYNLTSANGRRNLRNDAASAAHYSDFISEKVRGKKGKLVDAGEGSAGFVCFGYRPAHTAPDGTHRKAGTVLDPKAADAYAKAAADVIAGATFSAIADRWNDAGILTPRGNQWRIASVKATLMSPHAAGWIGTQIRNERGTVTGHNLIREGNWPAIVTLAQHRALVARITDPERRRKQPRRSRLLTSFLHCSECGAVLASNGRGFRCTPTPGTDRCGRVYIDANATEQLVTDAVVAALSSRTIKSRIAKARKSAQTDTASIAADLVTQLEAELDELADMLGTGELTPKGYKRATEGIRERLDVARAQLDTATDTDTHAAALDAFSGDVDVRATWDALDLQRQRAIVAALISDIVVTPAIVGGPRVFHPERVHVTPRDRTR